MALVLHVGLPFTPPIINGYRFEPQPDGIHWAADVAEADFGKFGIGEDGARYFLHDGVPGDPLKVYKAAPNKGEMVLLAKENLGLDLDASEKKDVLLAAIEAELKARGLM